MKNTAGKRTPSSGRNSSNGVHPRSRCATAPSPSTSASPSPGASASASTRASSRTRARSRAHRRRTRGRPPRSLARTKDHCQVCSIFAKSWKAPSRPRKIKINDEIHCKIFKSTVTVKYNTLLVIAEIHCPLFKRCCFVLQNTFNVLPYVRHFPFLYAQFSKNNNVDKQNVFN